MSVSPSVLAEQIANEVMNRYKDKSPSGNLLRMMLAEAAEEGYQEGILESR